MTGGTGYIGFHTVLELFESKQEVIIIYNLGLGNDYSVLEMIKASELGWQAERGLADMMQDTWRWQSNNPNGYNG